MIEGDHGLGQNFWYIVFLTWIPCFNILLSMASMQTFIYKKENVDMDNMTHLKVGERINNVLILIPFFCSPMKVVCESVLLWFQPEFDFQRSMLTYLKIFFTLAMTTNTLQATTVIIALYDDSKIALVFEATYLGTLMLMVLTHNFMHLKLGMFVQMMPAKYRW